MWWSPLAGGTPCWEVSLLLDAMVVRGGGWFNEWRAGYGVKVGAKRASVGSSNKAKVVKIHEDWGDQKG